MYKLTLSAKRGPGVLKRVYTKARDEALRAAGMFWTDEILPLHFDFIAQYKYRYKARTWAYMRRKAREGRQSDPNVYTGRLRDKMTSTEPTVKVTKDGITLIWRGLPRYTYITDTLEWVANDWRWNDVKVNALNPAHRIEILNWRKDHPETKDGRFKRVSRPNKPAEITTMNRADAKAIGKRFRDVFQAKLREMRT